MRDVTVLQSDRYNIIIQIYIFGQQSVLEDFEETPTLEGFEGLGSAAIEADPATGGTNGDTFKLVTASGGNGWQGAQVDLPSGSYADLTTDKTTVFVYGTNPKPQLYYIG